MHATFPPALILLLLAAAAGSYGWAALRQPRWNRWRTLSFLTGLALLLAAALPAVAEHAHHDLRWHMLQHILVGMLAPLALVLGAPLTLTLRNLPTGSARTLARCLRSRLFRWWSHPWSAFMFNIGGMFALYLTPLYTTALSRPWLHHLIHVHFLLAGYLFSWAIAGLDRAPRRPSFHLRVAVLLLAIAAHATLSKLMYVYLFPYNTHHSAAEIRAAAQIMYYGGDLAELLLAIALFAQRYDRRRGCVAGRRWAETAPIYP